MGTRAGTPRATRASVATISLRDSVVNGMLDKVKSSYAGDDDEEYALLAVEEALKNARSIGGGQVEIVTDRDIIEHLPIFAPKNMRSEADRALFRFHQRERGLVVGDPVEVRVTNSYGDSRYLGTITKDLGNDRYEVREITEIHGGSEKKAHPEEMIEAHVQEIRRWVDKPLVPEDVSRHTVATQMREELKERFPDTSFDVKHRKVPNGPHVVVAEWTDGPVIEDIREITDKYDGVYEKSGTDLMAFAHRKYSRKTIKKVAREMAGEDVGPGNGDRELPGRRGFYCK